MSAATDDTVTLDFDQIARVLTNLLINASQAMDGQGRIVLEASRVDGAVQLRVRDNGPGIPASVRPRIFEALFTTKAKGTGLGLALSRRIMEAHAGTIALEPSDVGATFLVTIPEHGPFEGAT